MSYVICVSPWSRYQRAKRVQASHFYVPTSQYVPKVCQLFNLACQRAKGVPMFQLGPSTYETACQFFKHSSYKMLREISILYYYIKNSILYLIWYVYVSYIKIVLYFISILHVILKKSVRNFCFWTFFCSLVKNENTNPCYGYVFEYCSSCSTLVS